MVSSGAATAAYILAPLYAQASGVKIVSEYGASIGNAPDSIPSRLARRRGSSTSSSWPIRPSKAGGRRQGAAGSRADLGRSLIGASVKKGTPSSTSAPAPALKHALLNAKSVAYSASASGTYLSEELFAKPGGVADRMKVTAKKIMSERVGAVVARGDAELGFQQASELLPFTELDYLGPIPDEVQQKGLLLGQCCRARPIRRAPSASSAIWRCQRRPGVIESTWLTPVAKR